MRPRVSWMTRADDHILELLDKSDIAANPSTISFNVGFEGSYVSRRCNTLAENGLLDKVDDKKAMFKITEKGRKYLAGELDADDLEEDKE